MIMWSLMRQRGKQYASPPNQKLKQQARLCLRFITFADVGPNVNVIFLAGSIFNDWTADFIGPYDERRTLRFDDTENTFTLECQPEPLEPNEELYMPDPRY